MCQKRVLTDIQTTCVFVCVLKWYIIAYQELFLGQPQQRAEGYREITDYSAVTDSKSIQLNAHAHKYTQKHTRTHTHTQIAFLHLQTTHANQTCGIWMHFITTVHHSVHINKLRFQDLLNHEMQTHAHTVWILGLLRLLVGMVDWPCLTNLPGSLPENQPIKRCRHHSSEKEGREGC